MVSGAPMTSRRFTKISLTIENNKDINQIIEPPPALQVVAFTVMCYMLTKEELVLLWVFTFFLIPGNRLLT